MRSNKHEGFDELTEQGFISEYVMYDRDADVWRPAFTLEHILKCGFKPKGTKLRFDNHNGYDYQRKEAAKVFDMYSYYTVKECSVGRSSSTYKFEEVDGSYNTVMFSE